MKKWMILAASALLITLSAGAQEKKIFNPQNGDFSIGVTFNPLAIQNHTYQPETNAFAGNYIKGLGGTPKQMFILATDPLVSFQLNYHFSPVVSLRVNFGITGSVVNYNENVVDALKTTATDGLAYVQDHAISKLNGTTIGLGLEFTKPFGRLAFVGGFGLQYAMGGGSLAFSYGNELTKKTMSDDGTVGPATMPFLTLNGDGSLNEWNTVSANAAFDAAKDGESYTYGRPLERHNVGMNHGIGLTANMGIEWFFAGRMSLSAAVTFTPIMVVFQPQTYTKYEVWDNLGKEAKEWDRALVSEGSRALLYGTQNIGLRLAFKYYL